MLQIILGNDPFLEKLYFDKFIKKLGIDDQALDQRRFNSHEASFTFDLIWEALYTPSLFQEPLLVYLEVFELKKEQEEKLMTLLSNDFKEDHFFIVFKVKPKGNTKLGRLLKKLNAFDLDKDNKQGFQSFAKAIINEKQIKFAPQAQALFMERLNHNYQSLALETDKLAVLDREISVTDVKQLTSKSLEEDVFKLSDAILRKDVKVAFDVYDDLQEQMVDPLQLLGLLGSNLRRIFQISTLAQKGYQTTSISQRLALGEKQVYFLSKNRQRDHHALLPLMASLAQIDYKVKTGRIDKHLAFEMWLLEATTQKMA